MARVKRSDFTDEEWRERRKGQQRACRKAWEKTHREKRLAQYKAYREAHQENRKTYREIYKDSTKQALVFGLTGRDWEGEGKPPFECHHLTLMGRDEDRGKNRKRWTGIWLYTNALKWCEEHGWETGRKRYSIEWPDDHKALTLAEKKVRAELKPVIDSHPVTKMRSVLSIIKTVTTGRS